MQTYAGILTHLKECFNAKFKDGNIEFSMAISKSPGWIRENIVDFTKGMGTPPNNASNSNMLLKA